jgi:membrane peptidoglycan carboxypeptidase
VAPNLPAWCPANFEFKYNGPGVRLRQSLPSSLNVPAVKVLRIVGAARMAETAHLFGITTLREPYRYGLTLTLGTSEVSLLDNTFGYATIANDGYMVGEPVPLQQRELGYREYQPAAILKITDPSGKVVYQYTPPPPKQVFSPQATWLITTSLSDDRNRWLEYAPGGDLTLDRPSAAKTGTTQYLQDTWTVGYTPDLVTGVWVGNTDGTEMQQVAGLITAGNIWHHFMTDALKYLGVPPRDFTPPPGVAYGPVCGEDGWYIVGVQPICYVP